MEPTLPLKIIIVSQAPIITPSKHSCRMDAPLQGFAQHHGTMDNGEKSKHFINQQGRSNLAAAL